MPSRQRRNGHQQSSFEIEKKKGREQREISRPTLGESISGRFASLRRVFPARCARNPCRKTSYLELLFAKPGALVINVGNCGGDPRRSVDIRSRIYVSNCHLDFSSPKSSAIEQGPYTSRHTKCPSRPRGPSRRDRDGLLRDRVRHEFEPTLDLGARHGAP